MRVLLAEDDSIIADGIARALRKAGYAVDLAENGTDADTALQSCTYDLAILDIGLPRMTGLEVLRRLRARNTPAAPHVPVLMLTAHDAPADRVKGLDLGADDYMGKPFDLEELAARARALIRRNSGGSPQMVCGNLSYDQVGRVATLLSLIHI